MKLTKIRELLRCPKELPVETALCVTFYIIFVWHMATEHWDGDTGVMLSAVNDDILMLFVPLFVLTFFLHKVNRWAYYLSYFLFIPLMMVDLKPFLWSTAFGFTYVLAAILLLIGIRRMDNRPFAAHLLHVVTQIFFGVLVAGLLNLALVAISASFFYIFGIKEPTDYYEYLFKFVWIVVAPLACATFISRDEYAQYDLPKVLRLILNAILTPAVIIYTVILYAYFLKIALTWNLPKGGVAYMVMAFITVSLAGYLTQYMLPKRYYDWFYKHFTWIAIPPLIMFWVGSIYRIRLYSFTEGRFYLLVAGVLMTLFVFMLLWKKTRKFQLMVLILGAAIVLFTYIPGISAKAVGLRCQTARMEQMIKKLHLTDPQTGQFIKILDTQRIASDSLLSAQYVEAYDIAEYLRHEMGDSRFVKKYGRWDVKLNEIMYNSDSSGNNNRLERTMPIDLGEYGILLNPEQYRVLDKDTMIVLRDESLQKVVLKERMKKAERLDSPDLYVYDNDSLLVIFSTVWTDSLRQVCQVSDYSFQVFRKNSHISEKK